MFKPTSEQNAVIDHFDGHGLVIAGPGSGKTVTLIAHVKKLILERQISPDDMWVMAFNRDISAKLREKLQELGEKTPETTTIHTFIFRQFHRLGKELLGQVQIADDLGECGKSNLLWTPIRERLTKTHGITKTSEGRRLTVPHIKRRLFNRLRDSWLIPQEPADDLLNRFKYEVDRFERIYKIIFLDQLAIKFLEAIIKNPSFRHQAAKSRIIIDEFQDLDPTEHAILQEFQHEGSTFMVFGDDDQAVNDFRRAHADFILEFSAKCNPKQFPLARDRRCPKEILDLADEFVKGLPRFPKPAGNAHHKGTVDVLSFPNDEKEKKGVSAIVKKYVQFFPQFGEKPQILVLCGRAGVLPNQPHFAEIIKTLRGDNIPDVTGDEREDPFDSEWGVAFESLLTILVEGISPMNLAAWLSVTNRGLMKAISTHIEAEERKGNTIDYLRIVTDLGKRDTKIEKLLGSIETLKEKTGEMGFDTKSVIDFIPTSLKGRDEGISIAERIWKEYQDRSRSNDNPADDSKQTNEGFEHLKFMRKHISENISPEIGRVHVTTYRKAKGLEADLVIVTSVDSSEFNALDQKRRLLYVAATRSKRNLILTFAERIAVARQYKRGQDEQSRENPRVYCSPLIPISCRPREFSEAWLESWIPV